MKTALTRTKTRTQYFQATLAFSSRFGRRNFAFLKTKEKNWWTAPSGTDPAADDPAQDERQEDRDSRQRQGGEKVRDAKKRRQRDQRIEVEEALDRLADVVLPGVVAHGEEIHEQAEESRLVDDAQDLKEPVLSRSFFFQCAASPVRMFRAPAPGRAAGKASSSGLTSKNEAPSASTATASTPGDDGFHELGVGGPAALRAVPDEDPVGVEDRQRRLEEGLEVDDRLVELLVELVPGAADRPQPVLHAHGQPAQAVDLGDRGR